ncbi:condensation domain-containing protein [Streptomyces sp. UMAF16]|nr:condensation domain-containing protein [Streptomyces sp. UMAF16]
MTTDTTEGATTALVVPFAGPGLGRVPLNWGQRTIWEGIRWLGEDRHYYNIRRTLPVPSLAPAAAVAALRTLVERHQALRTYFTDGSSDGTGGPVQDVRAEGKFTVAVRHAPTAEAAAETAAALLAEQGGRPFEAGQWPVRFCLVMVADRVKFLNMVLDHQTADGSGAALVVEQLTALLNDRPADETPGQAPDPAPARWQPLDQAEYETAGEGARRGKLSLEYWRRQLAVVPLTMFDMPPREPEEQRFWKVRLTSPAAAVAATRIAERTGRTTSAVLLTATSLVLSRLTGHTTGVLQLIVANRFDDNRRALVSELCQDGLFVLDRTGVATFDGLVEAAYRSALVTYRYGFYDRVERDALIARVAAERGGAIRLSSYFNDARLSDDWSAIPKAATADELRALTAESETDVLGKWERQEPTFFLAANECAYACRISLLSDTAFISVAETGAALRAIEAALVAAAFEDVSLTAALAASDLAPIPRPTGTEAAS